VFDKYIQVLTEELNFGSYKETKNANIVDALKFYYLSQFKTGTQNRKEFLNGRRPQSKS